MKFSNEISLENRFTLQYETSKHDNNYYYNIIGRIYTIVPIFNNLYIKYNPRQTFFIFESETGARRQTRFTRLYAYVNTCNARII